MFEQTTKGYSLIWPHCVSEEDRIFKALSLNRVNNFTFYNKLPELGVDLFGSGIGRLAMSGLLLWYLQLFFRNKPYSLMFGSKRTYVKSVVLSIIVY